MNPEVKSRYSRAIEHVFFPMKLTGNATDIIDIEGDLLTRLSSVVDQFMNSVYNVALRDKFQNITHTFKTWESLQCQDHLDATHIAKEIRALSPGETFALYIRSQNVGIMITIPVTEVDKKTDIDINRDKFDDLTYVSTQGIFSVFPASLQSKEVTSTAGNLAAIFPRTAICIPRTDILNSESFARQLSSLTAFETIEATATITKAGQRISEYRDVADPLYVTHWLAAVLSNDECKAASHKQLPRVVKKIRDSVVFESSVVPFRRSGLWMTAKAVLQICLIQNLGELNGSFVYKLIILKFLLEFLNQQIKPNNLIEPWLTMEMIGKVARRSRKVQLSQREICKLETAEKLHPCLITHCKYIFEDSARILTAIHKNLMIQWDYLIEQEKIVLYKKFLIKGGTFIKLHSLVRSKFQDYIHTKKQIFIDVAKQCIPIPATTPRHRDLIGKFNINNLIQPNEEDLTFVLYDFENHVKNWDSSIGINDFEYVSEIFLLYIKAARPYYTGDPVGASRMILTCLKIIQIWDKLVTLYFPMLLEHRPGIEMNFSKELLIPNHEGMDILLELEEYFEKRSADAAFPSLIEEQGIFRHSFSARYGETLPGLINARKVIWKEVEKKIASKLKEVQVARNRCEKLKTDIKTLECEYTYTEWKREHKRQCRKCLLSNEYKNTKVKVYERPLPTNEECQYAVLLELVMPGPIACLRDLLFLFGGHVTCSIILDCRDGLALYGPWQDYKALTDFISPVTRGNWFINLMSTKKLFLDSHYDNLHPSNPDSDFIKNNGYNCRIAGDGHLFIHSQSTKAVKTLCTLRVTKKTPYSTLQYAIDGDFFTPNQVLAKQNECHPDLSLQEFVEFGSLRSFSRLQIRNIYRALTQMTLSLKNESVFNLICQCLWQTGPALDEDGEDEENINPHFDSKEVHLSSDELLRQAHQDLNNPIFIQSFIELLEGYRQKHAHNWKDHYVLLSMIVICCRVAELCEDVKTVKLALELLDRCRNNALAWSLEVQGILSTCTTAPRVEVDLLRIKMIEINTCSALTFTVGVDLIESILDSRTIKSWLLSIANIYDNLVLIGSGHKSQKEVIRVLPVTLQNLLRRVQETGLLIEPHLCQRIAKCEQVFTSFVKDHYAGAASLQGLDNAVWEPFTMDSHIYWCELKPRSQIMGLDTTTLQMDIIGGGFLVDGCPVSYLPSRIENHELFQRTFPTKSFSVGPYPFQKGRMMSLEKFLPCESNSRHFTKYSFFLQKDNSIIITEHRYAEVQQTWQLLPYYLLENNIPHILIENFTHWWNKDSGVIEFYKRDKNSPSKLFLKDPTYKLELKTCKLIELSSERQMVDINCQIYQKILGVLESLECYKYINIWYDPTKKNHVVELPRMGLKFNVNNPDGVLALTSKEYRGMKVSDGREPGVSTLVGLRNGLLLIDADIKSKTKMNSILLVPHGTPVIVGSNHVKIRTDVLRTPTFFAYEVDSRLRQLKAGECQAGWVFLAYLHATTTSHLPDPFTGVTGTERAFQILQSGHVWSAQPMDLETVRTLYDIAQLSPERVYYPSNLKNMESVNWPQVGEDPSSLVELPPHVAHDGYQLMVEKLIEDSVRLKFLFRTSLSCEANIEKYFEFRGQRDLCIKSYWRRIGLSTELGRIYSRFDETFDLERAPVVIPSTFSSGIDFNIEEMKYILDISQLCHSWKCRPPKSSKLLIDLLLNKNDLQGLSLLGFSCKEDWRFWSNIDFRDSWLSLYELARGNPKRRRDLSEWIHLLTQLVFRRNESVELDQIHLLHTVAVNYHLFKTINPPPYQEYFMTNEYSFNYDEIVKIFTDNAIPWGHWMDRQKEMDKMGRNESIDAFIDRMKPIYDEEIDTVAKEVADLIKQKWPIESCDGLFFEHDSTSKTFDSNIWNFEQFEKATTDVNMLIRNWYRNRLLFLFLDKVECTVNILQTKISEGSSVPFVNTTKAWTKNCPSNGKRLLKLLCERKPIFTIEFEELIGERREYEIDQVLFQEAEKIFNPEIPKVLKEYRNDDLIKLSDTSSSSERFPLELRTTCPIMKEYVQDLTVSWTESKKRVVDRKKNIPVTQLLSESTKKVLEMWEKVKSVIKPRGNEADSVTKMLINAEIFPRVTPLSLFPLICRKDFALSPEKLYLNYVRNLLGAYGVLLTQDQRYARCYRYKLKTKELLEVEINSELSNTGHENWSPSERPEWLLFELEMDLMIRPIQAKVAERMENPHKDNNALLQLNMGEGKTAVIVPLIVLSLANGKRLCRITVLKSLFEINQKALIARIGGLLLARRVYTFPCRRDFQIGHSELEDILYVYKECMNKCGVVIGLAEHRLSFKLKAYETCGAENFVDGRELLEIQHWLDCNARDVLDESDEILQVKYQLIYTLGKQTSICGGSSRWTIIQKVLRIIPRLIPQFHDKFGSNSIEYTTNVQNPQGFPYCRLLKSDCYEDFCKFIVEEILSGTCGMPIPEITSEKKPILMNFLTNDKIEREDINNVYKIYPLQSHLEILLILRGLLACGVLSSALSKRWRVNYGVNPSGYRRMAVPFRAKDVAAERTEFGHPDIAIVLTQLSYYYSGLNESQLEQCFVNLFLQPDPALEYQRWIELVPKTTVGYESIRHISGVNLKDFFQRTKILFPALEKNISTIDFWLGTVVFPQESKQFSLKIGCSPWDLCVENACHPTTGFSGTNDSRLLLPKTICQNDLPELQGTNGEVLINLLRDENNKYEALPLLFTGRQILEKLVEENIRLLLDVGALMLELNNEQVANAWLNLVAEEYGGGVDAAVYFDEDNKLVVIDRITKVPMSLETSNYRTRLDSCVIYLDDAHTRGTDLKIPAGVTGCVTLGKGVTKDKLVQGCMRMRKLGQGHRVIFWASHEVDNVISSLSNDKTKTGTREVLEWAIENSRCAIEEGFIHWAGAGVYQAQKLSSHVIYGASKKTNDDLKLLADGCSEKETLDLKTMYGEVRSIKKFPIIVDHLLKRVNRELQKRLSRCAGGSTSTKLDVNKIVETFGQVVVQHSKRYVPEITKLSQCLEEEQERELEHEQEAQHEKEVPTKIKSYEHSISEGVTTFINFGHLNGIERWAVKLPLVLKNTRIWNKGAMDTWGKDIYASHDFIKVAKSSAVAGAFDSRSEDIIRPPHWICTVSYDSNDRRNDRTIVLLLLSPYEVNHYIPSFSSGKTKGVLHMFAGRLCPDQETLYRNPQLVIPTGKDLIPDFSNTMHSALLMFSGSSYFVNKKEQDNYCRFAGFCLKERTTLEDAIFQKGGILNGFVDPKYMTEIGYVDCRFDRNPEGLIKGIIELRNGRLFIDSHVGIMLLEHTKPFQQ